MKKFPIRRFRKNRSTINRTTKGRPPWRRYLRMTLINIWKGAATTLGGGAITSFMIWFNHHH